MIKDSIPKFKMSHIRTCFSTIGDTTLSKWTDKSLVPHHSYKKGIRGIIRYSALEIVHVGVLSQLSTWGVLTYYKDVRVLLYNIPATTNLTRPDGIIDYYSKHGPDLGIIVSARQYPVKQDDQRMRRTKPLFELALLSVDQIKEWERDREGVKADTGFGYLKINLKGIIEDVCSKLGAPQ